MTVTEPRQTARYERKREAILEAAALLFNARGLGGATLADVAQQVGLTTTSVTYYYRRKEDLAAACVMQAIEAIADLVAIANAEPSPPRRLTRFVSLYMALQKEVTAGRRPPLINFWDLRAMTGPGAELPGWRSPTFSARSGNGSAIQAAPSFTRSEQNARTHLVFSALLAAKEWIARFEIEDYERGATCLADVLIGGLAGSGSTWSMIDEALPLTLEPPKIPREAFLRAATELINEQGYRGASVDRISAKLRVTKGSFYHHNDTKDELVRRMLSALPRGDAPGASGGAAGVRVGMGAPGRDRRAPRALSALGERATAALLRPGSDADRYASGADDEL